MNDDQSVADPAAEIGRALATGREVDLRGAALPAAVPPRLRPDGTARPSLDARAASVGKDMLCTGGFTAAGGVRIRRMEARKSVQFVDATLGTPGKPDAVYALNAYGPETPELVLRPAGAPAGRVRLARAQMGTFADAESLWAAAGVSTWTTSPTGRCTTHAGSTSGRGYGCSSTRCRTSCPARTSSWPRPTGRAGTRSSRRRVLLARQRRRHAEAGPAGRVWGARAAARDGGVRLPPLDGFWRLEGASQWISSGLVTAGWILATTAAAGAARILERV